MQSFQISLEVAKNAEINKTAPYHVNPATGLLNDRCSRLVLRRGGALHLTLPGHLPAGNISLNLKDLFTGKTFTCTEGVLTENHFCLRVFRGQGSTQLVLDISPRIPIKFFLAKVFVGQESSQPFEVAIVANPHHTQDPVYVGHVQDCQDYLYETQTNVATISGENEHTSKPWKFDQFHSDVLEFAFLMMQRMPARAREEIHTLSRELTAVLNSQDPNLCVLVGNWDGNYSRGTSPLAWTGSLPIISEYLRTRRPVRYGQCWVYASLYTTVLRCLGIPSRCVSAVRSATPSTGKSEEIDKFYYADGRPIKELSAPIWNFHVWTEAYMTRPDLSARYNGWQALDPSPVEETSPGVQLGPAPRAAIKEASEGASFSGLPMYDVEFFYSQVHRTIRSYQLKSTVDPALFRNSRNLTYADLANYFVLVAVDEDSVGNYILKNSRTTSFENLRHSYKDPTRPRSTSRTRSDSPAFITPQAEKLRSFSRIPARRSLVNRQISRPVSRSRLIYVR